MTEKTEFAVFKHEKFGEIRTIEIDGEPWFAGKDIAISLGYRDTINALKAHVYEDDKMGWQFTTPSRGTQNITFINESGLYSLILSSKLPTAKEFKHWVTAEVLPAIRKHGMFATPQTIYETLANPESLIQILTALRNEQLAHKKAVAENVILKIQTKYYNEIMNNPGTVPITKISKDYGMSACMMNRLLSELGIQYRLGDTWVLYQEYAKKGYTHSRTFRVSEKDVFVHTYWTQKGRKFLYEKLKEIGIIPLIEHNSDDRPQE